VATVIRAILASCVIHLGEAKVRDATATRVSGRTLGHRLARAHASAVVCVLLIAARARSLDIGAVRVARGRRSITTAIRRAAITRAATTASRIAAS
jgi:hypothetical protein